MDRRWSKLRIAQRKRGHVHAIRGDILFHGHRDGAGEWDQLYGFVGPILRVILVSGRVAIQVIGSDLRLRWTKVKSIAPVALLLLSFVFSGCIGVTRVPERTRTPQGQVKKIDLSFLRPGETTRAEVLEKLKPIDTSVHGDRFFLGRWDNSKWSGWAFVGGDNSPAGGAKRLWHDVNFLAEFDDKGILKRYEAFPDKLLAEKLAPVAAETKLPSGTDRAEMAIQFAYQGIVPGKLTLTAGSMEFIEQSKAKKPRHFTVPRGQLSAIGLSVLTAAPDPVYVSEVLHFSGNLKQFGGPRGNRLYLRVTVPDLVVLLAYSHANIENKPRAAN